MKNVKLALATTLSVLAITFAGTASADNGKRYNKEQQNVIVKSKSMKNVDRQVTRNTNNKRLVRNAPTRKVVTTKRVVQKPAKPRFVANNKRYNQVRHNNKRTYNKNRYKKHSRFNVRSLQNQLVYTARSGGVTFQVSF